MKLNNIPLELDDRIFDIADIKTVITADEKDVGKMGYFANSIQYFKDLKGSCIKYGKLLYLHDLNRGGVKSDQCFVCDNNWAYRYFIPEEKLLPEEKPEKKYRAFTLTEWINQHEIGQIIHYRSKSEEVEAHIMYMGTYHHKNKGTIVLGVASYTLDCLFEEFEIEIDGEWQPFGVLVEENEE